MLRKTTVLAAFGLALALAAPALSATTAEEPRDFKWSFQDVLFGKFNQEQLQRGYKVYHEVCSTCHSMNLLSYRNLADKGGPFYDKKYPNPNESPVAKAIAKEIQVADIDTDTGDANTRPATTSDHFKNPYANEYAARAAFGGALPPDLSLMAKAREGGPAYIASLVSGFPDAAPDGLTVPDGKYYNPWFPGDLTSFWTGKGPAPKGGFISMPPPLHDDSVTYDDGVKATKDQEAQDVAAFLAWAAEPHQEERKETGFAVLIYLLIFAGLLYASYRTVWRNIAH